MKFNAETEILGIATQAVSACYLRQLVMQNQLQRPLADEEMEAAYTDVMSAVEAMCRTIRKNPAGE